MNNTKATLIAIFTVIVWGSTFATIRAAFEGGYTPGHLLLVRYLIASSLFIIYALFNRSKFRLPKKEDILQIFFLGLIGISVYHMGVTFGEQTVEAGTAGMIIGSGPIFTSILAVFLLKERLGKSGWIGMFIGFIGLVFILLGTSDKGFNFSSGVYLILIAAFSTSLMFVFQKRLLNKYSPMELTAYFTWAGTIPFLFFAPGILEALPTITMEAHLTAIYAGIFPGAIAYVTWSMALKAGNASTVSSYLYAEPVVAIIISWLWLNELPSTLSIIGGIIAIGGVIIVNTFSKKTST